MYKDMKKQASILSKLYRFLPKSKTLEKATTKQVVRVQNRGNEAAKKVIRSDMDTAATKLKPKKTINKDRESIDVLKNLNKQRDMDAQKIQELSQNLGKSEKSKKLWRAGAIGTAGVGTTAGIASLMSQDKTASLRIAKKIKENLS